MSRLAGIARKEVFTANQAVFQQDTPGDKMYIVKEGQVEVRINDHNGHGHPAV
ncbi:MAG: cyclic nucleotide-binding domain-containing protein, partial [Anaerolineae bacterium]|nr:cyclic nucleotide-binding domain-containing protein [Anaerolineae bacterium]